MCALAAEPLPNVDSNATEELVPRMNRQAARHLVGVEQHLMTLRRSTLRQAEYYRGTSCADNGRAVR